MEKTPSQQTDIHEAQGVRERTSESFEEPRRILNTAQQILDNAKQARIDHDNDMREIRQMMKEGAIEMKEIRQAIEKTNQVADKALQFAKKTSLQIEKTNQVADKALQFAKETSLQIDKLSKETSLQIDKTNQVADKALQFAKKTSLQIDKTNQVADKVLQFAKETSLQIDKTNQVADKALQFAKKTSLQIDKLSKETSLQIDKLSKETNLQIDKLSKETNLQIDKLSKETNLQIDKTNQVADEALQFAKETSRQIDKLSKDADRRDRAYDKRLKKLDTLFHGQWGKLMESLVKGDIIKLLQKRKIEVTHLSHEVSTAWDGKPYQFDIIAVNGSEVVVVEVKTTLDMADLNYFLTKLEIFKEIYPHHKDKAVYGAVAYLKVNQSADIRSEKEGLFVIRATGDSSSITNKKSFKPKAF